MLKWQQQTQACLELLISYLHQSNLGRFAAQGFEVLTQNDMLALTKESHCIIKFMYKQRFAQFVLPPLMESYHNSEDDVKSFLITAISSTLQTMPKQMFQVHLRKVYMCLSSKFIIYVCIRR